METVIEKRLEFDRATLPWIDTATDGDIEAHASQFAPAERYLLKTYLKQWRDHGYVLFENVLDHDLIDAYSLDVAELRRTRSHPIKVHHEKKGLTTIAELSDEDLREPHMRIVDFHHASVAGQKLALNPLVLWFVNHVFGQPLVMKQSLTFGHGPDQTLHQDFAYVKTSIPSHLCGVWYALEDVDPVAGPLRFYPGSQNVEKFDFGSGLTWESDSTKNDNDFGAYLEEKMKAHGWKEKLFHAKKGDVLIWHSGLVHGSSVASDRTRSRRSFVAHFSTRKSENVPMGTGVHILGHADSSVRDAYSRASSIKS